MSKTTRESKGLGKGFGSLLPSDFDESILLDKKDRVQRVPMTKITVSANQPRGHFDETALQELADSIKQFGILQPLVVTPEGEKFMIIAGERRFRAATLAGLPDVPALVRTSEELERLEISLVENVQRVDLSPLEQAVSIARLREQFNRSYSTIARRLGKAETTIINTARLLQLSTAARAALTNQQISEGHARAILALKEFPPSQAELLRLIIQHGWSVRQAEQFVLATKAANDTKASTTVKKRLQTETPETRQLGKKLHTRVTIARSAKGGRLQIFFTSDDELDKIAKQLLS